jgi:hypothetical protein
VRAGGWIGWVAAACAVIGLFSFAAAALGASPGLPDDYGNPSFCGPGQPLRDLGLSRLPPVHEIADHDIGRELGHPAIEVFSGGQWPVVTEPMPWGYELWNDQGHSVRVNWTVTARLWSLDSGGRQIEEIGHTGIYARTISGEHSPHIALAPPPGRRGFYRFDLRFESKGKLVGSYSSYFRVVPPRWRARFALSRTVARAGQQVLGRIENLGTEAVEYGEYFGIERERSGVWSPVPRFSGGNWLAWGGILEPGADSLCDRIRVPADLAPGRYRFVKPVSRPGADERWKGVTPTAPFRVVR